MATPIPDNLVEFSAKEVLEATGGTTVAGTPRAVRGVVTDSRREVDGRLFVPLVGERFDGHGFVAQVAGKGAAAVLIEHEVNLAAVGDCWVVKVDDTLVALGHLARAHRRRWAGFLVAVAGSAGKTTTRSAIEIALGAVVEKGAIHATVGNLNNRVGVPMVMFGLSPAHRVAVIEVGTNLRGEVAELARITEPEAGVLTLVDWEHAEGIGDLDEIEAEEGDLLRACVSFAIANGDDPRARRQLQCSRATVTGTYGTGEECSVRLVERRSAGLGSRLRIARPAGGDVTLDLPIVGMPAAMAVTAGVAVAGEVAHFLTGELPNAGDLAEAFAARPLGEPGRMAPIALADGALVLDDTYNANPASVLAAIDTAAELCRERGARMVLVLGEMRELGAHTDSEHTRLGQAIHPQLGDVSVAGLVTVAGAAKLTTSAARDNGVEAHHVSDATAALEALTPLLAPDLVILVKGSRGVRLERVVDGLRRQLEGAPHR